MIEDRPSFTASMIAFARGVGISARVRDPLAARLVPPPFREVLELVDRRGPTARVARTALRGATLGLADHASLRMRAIDVAVEDAVANGCQQLVVLGAGLDVRAYRMTALANVVCFEVDHPATQGRKRRMVRDLDATAREVRFVPIAFERETLGGALEASGHDLKLPTVWVWEGVTMYLDDRAVVGSLREIAARSTRGSLLAMTYMVRDLIPFLPGAREITQIAFEALGEPLRFAADEHEIPPLLRDVGFTIRDDSGSREWARRFGPFRTASHLIARERLVLAAPIR